MKQKIDGVVRCNTAHGLQASGYKSIKTLWKKVKEGSIQEPVRDKSTGELWWVYRDMQGLGKARFVAA